MLLVNDPGDAATVFAPLQHSAWHGWTPTDLIFPFFLFVVGVTTHLSLSRRAARGDDDGAVRRQSLRRAAVLFAIGLVLNWFPFYQSGAIAGHPSPDVGDRLLERLRQLRVLGVLQRIALGYLAASLLSWKAPSRRVAGIAAALLVGYWAAMALGSPTLDDRSLTLAARVDRLALDWTRHGLGNHLWDAGVTYDPEGVLSTIPAVATAMLGVLAGRWLATRRPTAERLTALGAAGALGMAAGLVWNWWFPINKALWTSSYALFTAGVACVALVTVSWLVDVARWDRWAWPFRVFGSNAILAYVGAELSAKILHSSLKWKVDGRRIGTEVAVTRGLTEIGFEPRVASLVWALLFVTAWYVVLLRCYRRGVFWKV
jgi:predicted acyltransferase